MILEEMVKLFIDSRKRGQAGAKRKCSPKTIRVYQRNLACFLSFLLTEVPEGGIVKYQSIKRLHMTLFLDWVDKKEASKEWSRSTVLQMIRCLKTFFKWVDKDEDCQLYELKGLHKYLPPIEKAPRRTDIPQISVLKKFKNSFNTANKWGYRNYVATSLLMTNGLRISELCSLTLETTRLEEKTLIVSGKQGTRLVPITDEMVRLLKGWLKRRTLCKTAEGSPYVFISKYKGSIDGEAFGAIFRKHFAKHGLPRITAHTYRHAFCTQYLVKGGNMERLRNITGHTSYQMLAEYLHLAKLQGKEAHDELEKCNMLKEGE